MLLCIMWSSNCCESNTQISRNPVFLNSLFCTCIPMLFLSISYPCIVVILQFKRALTKLLLLQIVVKENLAWFVRSCCAVVHPSSAAPTTEGSSTAGIRPPNCLSPPQIFFPAAGSHDNCITIIKRADDLEDYTGPWYVHFSSCFYIDIYCIMGCYYTICHNTYAYSLLFYKVYIKRENAASWDSGCKRSKY